MSGNLNVVAKLCLGFVGAFLLLLLPFNNIQFIILALVPLSLFCYIRLSTKRTVGFDYKDVSWISFIVLSLVSLIWSRDIANVWSGSIIWMSMFLITFAVKQIIWNRSILRQINSFLSVLFFVILGQHLVAIFIGVDINSTDWNHFLFKNRNVSSISLVSILPFFLFKESNIKRFAYIKVMILIVTGMVLIHTSARASIIAFVFICVMYIYRERSNFKFQYLIPTFSALILFGIYMNVFDSIIGEFSKTGEVGRLHLLNDSITNFSSNIVLGTGAGSWGVESFKNGRDLYDIFNLSNSIHYIQSHNLFTTILVELGIIGFILFYYPFYCVVKLGFIRLDNLSSIHLGALGCVFVYLLHTSFYCDASSYRYNYSNAEVLAFFSMGLLASENKKCVFNIPKTYMKGILLFSISVSFFWFCYQMKNWHLYQSYKTAKKNKNYEIAISSLEEIYNPIFYSSFDYKTSIPHLKAKTLKEKMSNSKMMGGEKEKTLLKINSLYRTAISNKPYGTDVNVSYARFLYLNKDYDACKHFANQALFYQSNYWDANLLYSDLMRAELKLDSAELFLGRIDSVRFKKVIRHRKRLIRKSNEIVKRDTISSEE